MQIKQTAFQWTIPTLTGLFLLELITRCLVPSNSIWLDYARSTPNSELRSGWTPLWRGDINIDGVGGQQGRYELRINPFGFRGISMQTAKKPESTTRIFFMGGSFVEEMAVPEEKTFPALVERRLSEAYPARRFECVNAGISGFMSPDLFPQLNHQILNYQPDMLVVTVPAVNDIRYGTLPEYNPDHPLPKSPEAQPAALLKHSRLLHVLYRYASRYQQAHTPYSRSLKKFQASAKEFKYTPVQQSKAYEVFIQHLQTVIQLAQKEGVKIILMSEPSIYQTPLPPEIKEILWMGFMRKDLNLDPSFLENEMSRFNAAAKLIAAEAGVDFIDLAQSIPKNLDYFYDDLHLTPTGSQKVAEIITEWLVNNPKLSNQAPRDSINI